MSEEYRVYSVIVGTDVAFTLHVSTNPEDEPSVRMNAALSSNPYVVESTEVPNVAFGWTYVDGQFIPPSEES